VYGTGKFARLRPYIAKLPFGVAMLFFAAQPGLSQSATTPSPSCAVILARMDELNRPTIKELSLQSNEFIEINPRNGEGAYLGKFVTQNDPDHSIIIRLGQGTNGYLDDAIVPNTQITPLVSGSRERALQRLKVFEDVQLSFTKGEVVRFRDAHGEMQTGKFAGKGWKTFKLDTNRGRISLARDQIFKNSPPSYSARPTLLGPGGLVPSRPSGILKDALDGNARLTSLPSYQALDDVQKVKVIMEYNQKILPYVAGSSKAENGVSNLNTIDDFICAGAGVCRHKSPVLTSMLRESGFEAATMSLTHSDGTGHVWVEVQLPVDGKLQTFVADPNTAEGSIYLKPLEEVRKLAIEDPASNEARYHAHPDKRPYRSQN